MGAGMRDVQDASCPARLRPGARLGACGAVCPDALDVCSPAPRGEALTLWRAGEALTLWRVRS